MKVELGPDAPKGCNGKAGSSGSQIHYRKKERCCDACKAAAKHYNQLLKGMNEGRVIVSRTTSKASRTRTNEHRFKRYGRWWKNEDDAEEYGRRDRLRHAARRAGWPYKTMEDLARFEAHREKENLKSFAAQERRALDNLRDIQIRRDHGRAKNATLKSKAIKHMARAYRHEQPVITDADKLAMIKKMIEDRTPIMDFMIRTSNLVGANLKGSNGNG